AVTSCGSEDTPAAPEQPAPEITALSPTAGMPGTLVTIYGNNFSSSTTENVILFNGVPAEASTASETKLETMVPEDAQTGPVTVTVSGKAVKGPVFTIDERIKFEGDYAAQKYSLNTSSSSTPDSTIEMTGTYEIE